MDARWACVHNNMRSDWPDTAPIGWARNALVAVVHLSVSVCLSMPCLTLSRQRKGVASWKLRGWKEARGIGDPRPHLEVERSKVKVTRLNAVTENEPYRRNGKTCKSPLAGGGGILWKPHYRPDSLLKRICKFQWWISKKSISNF